MARRGNKSTEDVEMPDDWGVNNDLSSIVRTARVIQRSGWQCLPRAGGLDDQPALLMDDVMLYFTLQDYIEAGLEAGDENV